MNDQRTLREDATKDPETLEREINQTRAEMNETLDSLERKLTAGQLLDQCLKFFGRTGSEIGSSIGQSVKENPMPVLLTATGIVWMMFGSGQNRSPARYSDETDNDNDSNDFYQDSGDGTLAKMGDKLRSGATAARGQLASSKNSVKQTVNKTTESVRDTVTKTASAAQAQAKRARDGFNSLLEDQPLIVGAMGVALGAAIGAAIPSTEQEDRLVGEIRDKTISKAKELGAESYEKGRETAKQAVESAVQTISGESSAPSTVHS